MGSKRVAALAGARLDEASKPLAMTPAIQHTVNCNICGMPEASFTSGWYRPGRPMSQSERLRS